ncbi:MAG: DUF2892 domain-containing protein [Candidatus Nanohaloarchaea archaeon]|nr:DUF2892 domain-containing protein [Candidatus Nanohaloarchaea archaeon]
MRPKKKFMRRLAGSLVTAGVLGGWFIHPYLYAVDLFVGLNMIQSSFTDFCPPEKFYDRYPGE